MTLLLQENLWNNYKENYLKTLNKKTSLILIFLSKLCMRKIAPE